MVRMVPFEGLGSNQLIPLILVGKPISRIQSPGAFPHQLWYLQFQSQHEFGWSLCYDNGSLIFLGCRIESSFLVIVVLYLDVQIEQNFKFFRDTSEKYKNIYKVCIDAH